MNCLVMLKGQHNLDEIILYKGLAGRDTNKIVHFAVDMANALSHLHSKHRIIHGDFKPRNIVCTDADYKLINFDASVAIGGQLTEKFSTGFIPPEITKVVFRPKDSLEDLNQIMEDLQQQKAKANKDEDDDALSKITTEIKKVKEQIKQIKSCSSDQMPTVKEGMDIWSYGVVMYQMLTGEASSDVAGMIIFWG